MILPIKKEWFDMILSGQKKEEYREIKPYYKSRFAKLFKNNKERNITFKNGYNKNSPYFIAICKLKTGTGKEEWGALPGKKYFILTIEKIKERSQNGTNL